MEQDVKDIYVWHNKAGRIIAWGHLSQGTDPRIKATPLAKRGQGVITVRMPERDAYNLHETHRVELKSRKLIRKKTG
jgi:hypothetical protein